GVNPPQRCRSDEDSVTLGQRFQIDGLPVALYNPSPNLLRRLVQLRLLVGVEHLLHADTAVSSMGAFEAGVQAVVTYPFAIAVARQLIQDGGDLRRQLIRPHLIGILESFAPELVLGQDGQNLSRTRR